MMTRVTSVLTVVMVAGLLAPVQAQAPPSAARIAELSEQWVDPVTDAPAGRDLIPHVDASYRTLARRESRGIEGMSMGGYGALHLGMKHPMLFGAISSVAPSILQDLKDEPKERTFDTFFDDEAYYDANGPWTLARENAAALRRGCAIRLLAGDQDARLRPTLVAFHDLLTQLGIPHQFAEVKGAGHVYEDIVRGLGDEGFAFWRRAFGASTPQARTSSRLGAGRGAESRALGR
jgi:S-formylglutathione hydrolase FrmB